MGNTVFGFTTKDGLHRNVRVESNPEIMEDLERYCRCGEPLRATKVDLRFSTRTGMEYVWSALLTCPKKKFFNRHARFWVGRGPKYWWSAIG